jgi:hypothetical protein
MFEDDRALLGNLPSHAFSLAAPVLESALHALVHRRRTYVIFYSWCSEDIGECSRRENMKKRSSDITGDSESPC